MIVLFIGDIVGPVAVSFVAHWLPGARKRHGVDLVVANAENCAPCGMGLARELVELLFGSGVDVITGGNHSWEGHDADHVLAQPRVLRPLNVAHGLPGRGLITLNVRGKNTVTVLNLADVRALGSAAAGSERPPYQAWLDADRRGTTIVDFHGDHVLEKQVFACAVDGDAAAVLGTHTHEPTVPLRILPLGTGFVADVGMTGPIGGVQGFDHRRFVESLKLSGDYLTPPLPVPTRGPITLGAVLLDIEGGRTKRLVRVEAECNPTIEVRSLDC